MSTNATVLVLPRKHNQRLAERKTEGITYTYVSEIQSSQPNIIITSKEFPGLRARKVFHVYVEELGRIYHVIRMQKEPHPSELELSCLFLDLGNSFVPPIKLEAAATLDYQYRELSEFGMTQVRPDMLLAIDVDAKLARELR